MAVDGAVQTAMSFPSSSSSSASSPCSNSSLLLHHKGVNLRLSVPDLHFIFLESHKYAFLSSYSPRGDPISRLELALSFLEFLLAQQSVPPEILSTALHAFASEFLQHDSEIHSLVADLTASCEERQRWLGIYYRVAEASDSDSSTLGIHPIRRPLGAFLQRAKTKEFQLMAVFGGQGESSKTCVKEFEELYASYRPMLRRLTAVIGPCLYELSTQSEFSSYFKGQPLDLEGWISDPATQPDSDFVSCAPVSVPIIGALSLARYCVTCHLTGLSPGDLRSLLQATTGHSQGILVSIAIAMSDSWDSFYQISQVIVRVLFRLGWECHRAVPCSMVSAKQYTDPGDSNAPSYMLNVRGVKKSQIETIIDHLNTRLPAGKHLCLSLINANDQFVVAGPVASLLHLDRYLSSISSRDKEQTRTPFSKRKPCIQHGFIPVSTPFHTHYLHEAAKAVKKHFADCIIHPHQLMIPVYHTGTGDDLRESSGSVISIAIDAIASDQCDWPSALAGSPASHIVVFDRGGLAPLVKRVREGWGVRVIQAGDLDSRDSEIGNLRDLLSPKLLETSSRIQSWGQRFQASVAPGGIIQLETRLNRILGAPPIIVAGMAPTTVHPDFVATVMNAGYHVELAGGGYHNASEMATAITTLARSIPPGRGVTCNLIYANPRAMAWQVALLRRLSHSRTPIDGLTIGAGVPSLDVASEYIETLGLRHISFKPGSTAAIRQVVEIAKRHPNFPVILQWTGGRGGGHHSFEDFHVPIFATYGTIRQHTNIYLVAGSGFGDSDSIYPYLTGSWSTAKGYPSMPFDGVLLGSRMMVAREAHASPAVKRIIIRTPGVHDDQWEKTYTGSAGGVITVKSEMGEPIHKIATRGVRLWAEMDKAVFSLAQKERVAYLREHRHSIIRRLNADFAKPWFGHSLNGDVVDLEDMTYFDVLNRLVELMYIKHQKRWIDPSYADFTMTIARRWLERLPSAADHVAGLTVSFLTESPNCFLVLFSDACPTAGEDLLNPEDVSFFLMECKMAGRKPVNFIPALDDDFEFYFKKDSLWQSEDVDAVIGRDADRVCILHGPVAAQYSQKEDESAADILNSITTGIISRMQEESSADEMASSSDSGLVTPASWSTISSTGRDLSEETSTTSITSLLEIPDDNSLSSGGVNIRPAMEFPTWVRSVLGNAVLWQDNVCRKNPFSRYMQSTPDAALRYDPDRSQLSVEVQNSYQTPSSIKMVCHNGVDLLVEVHPSKESDPLRLLYRLKPSGIAFGLFEVMENRNERIKSFYSKLWFGRDVDAALSIDDTFQGPQLPLTQALLDRISATTGSAFPNHRQMVPGSDLLPISTGIIVAWDVISQPLVLRQIDGDLLRLVHHSNSFEYSPGAMPLRVGDVVSCKSSVQAIYDDDAGKAVVVEGHIMRSGDIVMTVASTFLFRGSPKDGNTTPSFRRTQEQKRIVHISSELEESLLLSREWYQPSCQTSLIGKSIIFSLGSTTRYREDGMLSLHVTGKASSILNGVQQHDLGVIDFCCETCTGNPVLDFLDRKGKAAEARTDFDTPGWAAQYALDIEMPPSNHPYAELSKDYNPIHTSQIFSSLAGVPGTICHGMCTSAVAERALEHLVLEGDRGRLRRFEAKFTGMVMPREKLSVQIQHTGMIEGRMCFTLRVVRKESQERVLEAHAEVEQPATAYLFTGQGSQSKGMGMDRYNASPLAKALWDDIDQQLHNAYGWSVLEIVRNNPQSLTIHFGGRNGRKIRQKYLNMTTDVVLADGSRVQKPVLPGLTSTSTSYTFTNPRGLLYSTQFAQPAILTFEAAAFAELRAKGYVSDGAMYAGHSLGEFGALSALSRSLPTGALVELAFYRGLVMQASVARDDHGGTTYGMVAMNPKRVGSYFTQATLSCLVRAIGVRSHELLEIVNYNIDGEQYVCSGTTANLYVLGRLIDHVAESPSGCQLATTESELHAVIDRLIADARTLPRPIQLQRGRATIPLEGIDVPFHSSHLRTTVDRFRQCLLRPGFLVDNVDVERLVGKYIPNLMAKPFSLDAEYIREAFELTQSPVLRDILA